MEQLLFFGLGVLVVLAAAGVISMFRSQKQIVEMQSQIDAIERHIDSVESSIDREVERAVKYTEGVETHLTDELEKMYRYIDSRTDKLEDGVSKQIASLYQIVEEHNAKFNDNTAFVDGIFHSVDKLKQKVKETLK